MGIEASNYETLIFRSPLPDQWKNPILHGRYFAYHLLLIFRILLQYGTVSQDGSQHLVPAIPTHSNWPNQKSTIQPRGPWKKVPKKTKIAQSAWCEICKIECNTKDVLDNHKLGKKHLKILNKLNSAALVTSISATTHVNPIVPSNPFIGPSENPKKGTSGSKKKAETPQELEMKRRKVLEGGAAASAVRTCSFCNVVCNSDTVFRFHLAGQKHASMLKKSQQAAVTGTVWAYINSMLAP